LRNRFEIRQITAFWPGQRTRGAGRGLCRWNECEKGGEPGTQGCILSSPDKQNGNPGIHGNDMIVSARQDYWNRMRGTKETMPIQVDDIPASPIKPTFWVRLRAHLQIMRLDHSI